jgi:hypothetical protein
LIDAFAQRGQKMEFSFGVKSNDIKIAQRWVEQATGLKAEARESSDLGGAYFAFSGPNGEFMQLVRNRDLYDNEPVIVGCDEWLVAVFVQDAGEDSRLIKALTHDREHFVLTKKS